MCECALERIEGGKGSVYVNRVRVSSHCVAMSCVLSQPESDVVLFTTPCDSLRVCVYRKEPPFMCAVKWMSLHSTCYMTECCYWRWVG